MPEEELPSNVIRNLINHPDPNPQTINQALEVWASGLLAHEHPTQPAQLLNSFADLLNTPTKIPWASITQTHFLITKFLQTTADHITNLPDEPTTPTIHQSCSTLVGAVNNVLSHIEGIPQNVTGEAVYIILRISNFCTTTLQDNINRLSKTLCGERSLKHIINAHFPRIVHTLSLTLETESSYPDPSQRLNAHNVKSAIAILQQLITSLDERHLHRYVEHIYPHLHPLLEHVHQLTRCTALDCLSYLHTHHGVSKYSVSFLRGSLLFGDAPTAKIGLPLLCDTLETDIDDDEASKSRKRVLKSLKTLMTARDGQAVDIDASRTVTGLLGLPLRIRERLLEDGVMWVRALSDFLCRVSRLVAEGRLQEILIMDVCEVMKRSIGYCWILADGFRGKVVESCLVAVMEAKKEEVCIAVRGVLHVLACCNPGRMRRLLNDVEETSNPIPSLRRIVEFLDTMKPLTEVDCTKVDMGDMVTRFFPELNEF